MAALSKQQLDAELRAFLLSESVCYLATVDPATLQPRVTPMHLYLDAAPSWDMYVLSDEGSTKLANIAKCGHLLQQNQQRDQQQQQQQQQQQVPDAHMHAPVSVAVCSSARPALSRAFADCRGLQITAMATLLPHTSSSSLSTNQGTTAKAEARPHAPNLTTLEETDPDRAHALQVYHWQDYAKELGLTAPPRQAMLRIRPSRMELLDLTAAFREAHPGCSPKQVWTADDDAENENEQDQHPHHHPHYYQQQQQQYSGMSEAGHGLGHGLGQGLGLG